MDLKTFLNYKVLILTTSIVENDSHISQMFLVLTLKGKNIKEFKEDMCLELP